MAVAFDAFTASSNGTGDLSFTHTPVGTPRGVIVYIVQNADGSDSVTGVTYGGVAMSEMSGSPNLKSTGEPGGVHAFFLGSSIPTGAQTVAVSSSGTVTKRGYAITLTAGADTELVDVDATINSDSTTVSVTLNLGGRSCFCSLACFSGEGITGFITPPANWASRNEVDFGNQIGACYTYNIIGTSDVAAGHDAIADDAVMIATAVSEAAAPPPPALTYRSIRSVLRR